MGHPPLIILLTLIQWTKCIQHRKIPTNILQNSINTYLLPKFFQRPSCKWATMATHKAIFFTSLVLLLVPVTVSQVCNDNHDHRNKSRDDDPLKFKLAAIGTVLVAGGLGVSLPLVGKKFTILHPDNDVFFMIKAFAAGVILATGFVHILPDAFRTLTSPCLSKKPWREFPFSGFIAMVASIGTMMVDTLATGFYKKMHFEEAKHVAREDEETGGGERVGHVHAHAHGHAHGAPVLAHGGSLSDLVRQRIISQVLELGIVVHSVIIGISLGASQSTETVKPLLFALTFHQFFEGMGLGGCISQANFKSLTTKIMSLFFSLTTPIGIGVGIGISSVYKENSTSGLIVEGVFNSASAGILIYMALVDLLAADFMSPRMENNMRLQLGAHVSLLLGVASMSFLAIWT